MTRQTVLPPNHTAFEEAFDLTGARIDELAVEIPKLVRPWDIPATHLAWLAWGLSVDLWEPEWSEENHRTLAARALPMHARKGTQASIAEHIRIMGAEPRRFIGPPAKTFMMEGLTEEERQAIFCPLSAVAHLSLCRAGGVPVCAFHIGGIRQSEGVS